MKNESLKFYYVVILCLSSIFLFNVIWIPASLLYYIYYALLFLTVFIVIKNYRKSHSNNFTTPIFLILFSELLGAMNATVSWGQSVPASILGIAPVLIYILFFLLIVWKFNEQMTERLILILGFAYIIVFLISFVVYPTVYFGKTDEFASERGFQRLTINGIGFLFLLNFYSINKYLSERKPLWLLLFFLCIVCTIMSLTRTYIIFLVIFSGIFILRKSSNTIRIAALVVAAGLFVIITRMSFYKILMDQTNSQVSDANDDVRVRALNYYVKDFSPNVISKILGNGQPYINTGYSRFVTRLETDFGYFVADIGYVGFYTLYGVLAILSYIILIYKTYKTKVSDNVLFTKYYLAFVFTISIIIDAPFNTSFIPSIAIACYALSTAPQPLKTIYYSKRLPKNGKISNRYSGL